MIASFAINGAVTIFTHDEAGRLAVIVPPQSVPYAGGQPAVPVVPLTSTGYDTFGEAPGTMGP